MTAALAPDIPAPARTGPPAGGPTRFRLLGTVEVRHHGVPVVVGRPRQRAVLAFLLIHANQYLTADALIEAVWSGAAPGTARAQIQADVCAIRRSLRDAGAVVPISTWHQGYRLDLGPGQLDLDEFAGLLAAAREADARGQLAAAARIVREALGLWCGPALGDAGGAFVEGTRAALEDRRLAALEAWAELTLRLDEPDGVIAELRPVCQTHPMRERLCGLYMTALWRTGRAADALGVARALRTRLAGEHGLDPGRWFQTLERTILANP